MNALKILAVAAVVLLTACGGRGDARKENSAAARCRVLEITDSIFMNGCTDTLRFGRMRSGEIAVQNLEIVNRTRHPLAIIKFDRSCGCTNMKYDRRPIPAGAKQRVELTFDSRGERGWQFRHIDIRLGGGKPVRIFFEAQVE